jgi:hypothetical protein
MIPEIQYMPYPFTFNRLSEFTKNKEIPAYEVCTHGPQLQVEGGRMAERISLGARDTGRI